MWFLRIPKPNEKYIARSHAKDPFEGDSYVVTILHVKEGWVGYQLLGGSFEADSLLDFWLHYKRLQ